MILSRLFWADIFHCVIYSHIALWSSHARNNLVQTQLGQNPNIQYGDNLLTHDLGVALGPHHLNVIVRKIAGILVLHSSS